VPCTLLAVALVVQAAFTPVDFGSLGTALAIMVALYSAGAYLEPVRAMLAAIVVALGLSARELRDLQGLRADEWSTQAFWWLLVVSVVGLGMAVRHRRHAARMASLAAATEQDSAERARDAVVDERERIARELHDIVAHGVGAVVVQAEAAEELLSSDPDRTQASLQTIQRLGRESLTEMRRMVGILRSDDKQGLGPQPALSDLPALVARAVEAGLAVELVVVGEPRALSPGLEVSAYRVVQEGLTNVRKHCSVARAVVTVRYEPERLVVEIVDDGPPVERVAQEGRGHGLIGIGERIQFFGGEMSVGPRPNGGFGLTASFPAAAVR
jgi:signal transduction histidine kinase